MHRTTTDCQNELSSIGKLAFIAEGEYFKKNSTPNTLSNKKASPIIYFCSQRWCCRWSVRHVQVVRAAADEGKLQDG